jgi:carbonyl reductase 1
MAGQKVALVTGGNRGIGLEICRQLAEAGCRVYLGSRDGRAGLVAATDLQALKGRVVAIGLDVTDPTSIESAYHTIKNEAGGLDILVNNAGVALDGFDANVVRKTLNVNFYGVARVTDALLPLMREHSRIVMVSSGSGGLGYFSRDLRDRFMDGDLDRAGLYSLVEEFHDAVVSENYSQAGWPGAAYKVSKAGLNALTRQLAHTLEEDERHIRVNAVCPGWVRTAMGGSGAPRSVGEGAEGVVWAALLEDDLPTGGFFRDGSAIEW